MSGLNSLISDSTTKATTLPSWYSTAQQDAVNSATAGINAMPAIGNTVAGTAINNLSGPNNPFMQAQGNLNTIASGAANPWLTDASGNVTPNTNTAMGGLFAAQNQQLQTLLPQYEAPATAGAISSGNFGSLRGQTAADTAVTNAQANLFSNQMQEALQNQQTGVNASTGLGNVGALGVTAESTLGSLQQADPTKQAAALSTILNSIKAPETVTEQGQLSPLSQLTSISKALGMTPAGVLSSVGNTASSILDQLFGSSNSSIPDTGIPESTTPTVDNSDTSNNNYGTVDTNIPDYTGAVYPDYSTTP